MQGAQGDRSQAVTAIRHFNRFYTNLIGLLSRSHFDTRFTLTEARVILEIGRHGTHTQSALHSDLKADMGYLNRVVRRLAGAGLVAVQPSLADKRVLLLELTPAGRDALREIDEVSDQRTVDLIAAVSDRDVLGLVRHMNAVERILNKGRKRAVVERATAADIPEIRSLMREYAGFLGADLSFQDFERELEGLPGKYAPPAGALLIARAAGKSGVPVAAGCAALRKIGPGVCEMKRLFVRPAFRGWGLGRQLAARIVQEARRIGYATMRLDTLERLESAVGLYRSMGFVQIPPYCKNPLPGAMFWEKDLRR